MISRERERDPTKQAKLEGRIERLETLQKELVNGQNVLFNKLQPGGMPYKG